MRSTLDNLSWWTLTLMVMNVALLILTITMYREKSEAWTEYRFQETTRKILEKRVK
jgi:hypothetical protein